MILFVCIKNRFFSLTYLFWSDSNSFLRNFNELRNVVLFYGVYILMMEIIRSMVFYFDIYVWPRESIHDHSQCMDGIRDLWWIVLGWKAEGIQEQWVCLKVLKGWMTLKNQLTKTNWLLGSDKVHISQAIDEKVKHQNVLSTI